MMYQTFRKKFKFSILCCTFLFIVLCANSQEKRNLQKTDTVFLKKGSMLIMNKKTFSFDKDTVFYIPHTAKYQIRLTKEEQFYQNLEKRVKNNFWIRELHNIIVIAPSSNTKKDSMKTIPSIEPFIPYHQKSIRNITIKQLTVFGPTIYDTTRVAKTFIENLGNKLHIQSKQSLIKNNLLFQEGDLVNSYEIADNERLLRSLPFIEDAKIEIIPLPANNDSVDVLVIVKDVWSKAFNLKINDIYSGQFEIWDRNLFGTGNEFQNNILWDSRKSPGTGYEGFYRVNNIGGSFINGQLTYNNSFNTRLVGIDLNRSFFTPNIKYAGGVKFENIHTEIVYKTDGTTELAPIKYDHAEIWIGRSFLLNRKNIMVSTTKNLTFATKIKIDNFTERPEISSNSYYLLHNKKLYLFSLTYSQQAYFKSNYIYNFGRTEDIPVGGGITFTAGKEYNEFINRNYADFTFSSGKYFGNFGYLFSSFSIGSFFNKNNKEQGIIKLKFNYFSNLFVFGRFNFRQFFNFNYTQGVNRFDYEYLTINESNGIRGFKNDSVYGNRRITMRWETVCFTPWRFYDFKMVAFLFADHCWIKPNNKPLFDWSPTTGLGFGFRFRNERLVFNTIQIKFTIYPNVPSNSITRFGNLSGEATLSPPNFIPQAPDIIPFK